MVRLAILFLPVAFAAVVAQPKGPPPVALYAMPFAVEPGKTTKVVVRGQRLEDAKELRVQHPLATGKFVGNLKKIGLANNAPVGRLGDQEIEIELTLPKEVAGGFVPFTLVGPGGESQPVRVLVADDTPRVAEKEPNDGFKNAQPIALGIVEGKIERDRDIDVFRLDGKAGQRLEVEVQSGRWGLPLDAHLTLYDSAGRVLALDDDTLAPDARIRVTLPADGAYFVSLIDSHDLGGVTHAYRLIVRVPVVFP